MERWEGEGWWLGKVLCVRSGAAHTPGEEGEGGGCEGVMWGGGRGSAAVGVGGLSGLLGVLGGEMGGGDGPWGEMGEEETRGGREVER
jgi:hypothetical protein